MAGFANRVNGTLIGYSNYTKDGKTTHIYAALVCERKDSATGLYNNTALAEVVEQTAVLTNPKYGMKVSLYAELKGGKTGSYMSYSGIEKIKENNA